MLKSSKHSKKPHKKTKRCKKKRFPKSFFKKAKKKVFRPKKSPKIKYQKVLKTQEFEKKNVL